MSDSDLKLKPAPRICKSVDPVFACALSDLDPPLLNRNTHLGQPVEVRVELRVFGMVQFDPLRVWVSRHGFTRCGTPTQNYSTAVPLDNSNLYMWNINSGVDGVCPFFKRAKSAQTNKRCMCVMMGDTLDTAHGEAGFSTTSNWSRSRARSFTALHMVCVDGWALFPEPWVAHSGAHGGRAI